MKNDRVAPPEERVKAVEVLEGSRIRCGFYSKPRLPPHIRGREVWITPLPLRNAPFQIDESW